MVYKTINGISVFAFKKNIVNADIPESMFSLKSIGTCNGDMVYDERTDTRYNIDDEQYPIPDYAKGIERTSTKIFRWLMIVTGLVLIVSAIVMKYRKWRQGMTPKGGAA